MSAIQPAQLKGKERAPKSEEKSGFRTDIAGLRAVAVLLVLLCHFKIPGFDGGFIGPDIFFVISGFLITGLLAKEYADSTVPKSRGKAGTESTVRKSKRSRKGKISFTNFYLRRARRILPASLLVIFFINLYAFFNLNILQQSQIQNDSIWTVLFLANVNFLRQSMDYFAQGNDISPLQHYWTLSVEEQFYLVWPVLFIAATRLNGLKILGKKIRWRNRVLSAMLLLGAVSLLWLFKEFGSNPQVAYFSSFSRAWELAFGGILGFIVVAKSEDRLKITSPVIRLAALLVLLGSVALVTPDNFGHTLFIPVIATGVLLLSGADQTKDLTTRLLSNDIFLRIGAISYSLYLWHWPIYVYGNQRGLMDSLGERIAGIMLSILLATISYQFVELKFMQINLPKPSKKSSTQRTRKTFLLPAVTTLLMISIVGTLTYSRASFGISGSQATAWSPTIIQPSDSPIASNSSSASLLPAWNAKIQAGLAMKSIPNELANQLRGTQILDYPWKTRMSCRPDSELPAKTDGMATTFCQTSPVKNGKKLVVLGDSFAGSFMPTVLNAVDLNKWQVFAIFRLECMWSDVTPVGYKNNKPLSGCPSARVWMRNQISNIKPDLVILTEESIHKVQAPSGKGLDVWAKGADASLRKLMPLSKKILVVGMHPGIPAGGLSKCLSKDLKLTPTCFGDVRTAAEYRTVQKNLASKYSLGYLDLTPWLCTYGKCPPIIDGTIAYADAFHFTPVFAKALSPALRESLATIDKGMSSSTSPAINSGDNPETYLLRAADKVSSGKQIANPLEVQLFLKQTEGIHDKNGGWKCNEVQSRLFRCTLGPDTATRKWFAMGDSHMDMWKSTLRNVWKNQSDLQLVVYSVVHCANSLAKSGIDFGGTLEDKAACMPMHQLFLNELSSSNAELVILSDNTVPTKKINQYKSGFKQMLSRVKESASSILVLGQTPEYPIIERCINDQLSNINSCSGSPKSINLRRQAQQQAVTESGVEFWDTVPLLCLENVCPAILDKNVVSTDGSHLDGRLATILTPILGQKISSILQ